MIRLLFAAALLLLLTSCNKTKVTTLEAQLAAKSEQVQQLETQVVALQSTNSGLLERMSDLSIISKSGAASIEKSLESISRQGNFIETLSNRAEAKDSLNMALITNLKRSLADVNDQDVRVNVRGGKVLVSISDQLLFASGSAKVNARAQEVLAKVAQVINDHNQMDVLVEGHTDNVPTDGRQFVDNWDLSASRAAGIVRVLTDTYYVAPERLTAAGRAQYAPVENNDNPTGRGMNRRTEIVLTPNLDQFFALLEPGAVRD